MKIKNNPIVLTLITAVLWSTSAVVIKLIGPSLDSVQIVFFGSGIAFTSLMAVSLFTRRLKIIKKLQFKDILIFAGMGLIGIFLYSTLFNFAIKHSSGQEVLLLNYTWPIWTLIFASLISKIKLTKRSMIAMLISFVGVSLIIVNYKNLTNFSLLAGGLAMLAAVFYGLFSAFSKKLNYDKIVSTAFFYLFAFIYSSLYLLFTKAFVLPNFNQLAGLLWLGLMTSATAFVLWQLALKSDQTAQVTNLILITPFLSILLLSLAFRQPLSGMTIIGGVLVVAGILLSRLKSSK